MCKRKRKGKRGKTIDGQSEQDAFGGKMNLSYQFFRLGAQVVFSALFNVRVLGRENVPQEGPLLILSNHQSYLDPVLCGLGLHRELDYLAREGLFSNRYFGSFIRSLNAFPVQRDRADTRAMREVIRRLKEGRAITMFPEATRSADGRIRAIKGGFDLIVRRAEAVTIPTVIDGAYEAWPRHQMLPGMGRIYVQFGKGITSEEAKKMGREEFVNEINERLRKMQNQLRRRYGKEPFNYEGNNNVSEDV